MYQEQKEIIPKKGLNIPKSNHDGVYSITHYVIKFVSDFL